MSLYRLTLVAGLLGLACVGRGQAASAAPEVLAYADELPTFPGGEVALHRYLAQHVHYPAEARRRTVEGTVVVRFVVDEVGRIIDAEVARGVGAGSGATGAIRAGGKRAATDQVRGVVRS